MIEHAVALVLAAMPASAQGGRTTEAVPDKVDQLIVYDDADCPRDTDDTIASCIVVTGESPYRILATLRADPSRRADVTAAQQALILLRPMSGQGSCSTSGAGSVYGCAGLAYTDWKAARAEGTGAYYAGLIAQARAKRLGLEEADAADQQAAEDARAPD